jgi:hypothetical protein
MLEGFEEDHGGFTTKHNNKRSAFEYKYADYMKPLNKGSSKGVT